MKPLDRHDLVKEIQGELEKHADRSAHFQACQIVGTFEQIIRERIGEVGWEQIFPPRPEEDW